MKNTILILAAAATTAVTLQGQIPSGTKLIADVPFSFRQGAATMPAGRYELSMAERHVIQVRNPKALVAAISVVTSLTAAPSKEGYLRFQCYGASNQCFLRAISAPGSPIAVALPQSKVEKEFGASGSGRVALIDTVRINAAGE
jgi:hypothetical protein